MHYLGSLKSLCDPRERLAVTKINVSLSTPEILGPQYAITRSFYLGPWSPVLKDGDFLFRWINEDISETSTDINFISIRRSVAKFRSILLDDSNKIFIVNNYLDQIISDS